MSDETANSVDASYSIRTPEGAVVPCERLSGVTDFLRVVKPESRADFWVTDVGGEVWRGDGFFADMTKYDPRLMYPVSDDTVKAAYLADFLDAAGKDSPEIVKIALVAMQSDLDNSLRLIRDLGFQIAKEEKDS